MPALLVGLLVALLLGACSIGGDDESAAPPRPAGLHNPSALDSWLATLDDSATRRADVLLIGDSISEGFGAEWTGRPAALLQSALRAEHPVEGSVGAGYLPATNFAGLQPPWELVGSPQSLSTYGPGHKALALAESQSVTLRAELSRVRLWFSRDPGRTAAGRVRIDDRPVDPVDSTEVGSGLVWESPDLGPGLHEIAVSGTQPLVPFVLEAVETFGSEDDAAHGVHVYDAAHSGYTSVNWSATTPSAERAWEAAAAIGADVTVIHLGVNDRFWRSGGRDVSGRITEIAQRAAVASGDPEHPVLVVVPYQVPRPDAGVEGDDPVWADIRAHLLDLAGGNIAVLDLDSRWPDLVAGGEGHELMHERSVPVHPSPAGHREIARILSEALSRAGS